MTYDEAERIARAAANLLPPCDNASLRAIEAVAHLLVAAYQRGRADGRAEPKRPWEASNG